MKRADIALLFLGGFLGLSSVLLVDNYRDLCQGKRLARILLPEMEHNYRVSKKLAGIGRKWFDAESKEKIQEVETPPQISNLQLIHVLDFRRTVFEATIINHGILPLNLLSDLHEFYWTLTKIEKVRGFASDEKTLDTSREGYLRASFHQAVALIDRIEKTDLLANLKRQSSSGYFCW